MAEDGSYTFAGLGPYEWPLFFDTGGQQAADQFSGGTANRFEASTVKITAGATATYNMTLPPGTRMTGTLRDPAGRAVGFGFLMARNGVTGDVIGAAPVFNGQYSMSLSGNQQIYLEYEITIGEERYQGFVGGPPGFAPRRPAPQTQVGGALDSELGASVWNGQLVPEALTAPGRSALAGSLSAPPRRPAPPFGLITVPGSGMFTRNIVIDTD